MVDLLGDEYDFYIVTRDRDFGDKAPYGLPRGTWVPQGLAKVYYLSPSPRLMETILELVEKRRFDVIYLNSLFSPIFSFWPLLLMRTLHRKKVKVVLAPRGELATSALAQKPLKKRVFVSLIKALGTHRNVVWQASSSMEARDIQRVWGDKVEVQIASDLPPKGLSDKVLVKRGSNPRSEKRESELRVVFLSRIARIKNLHWALERLAFLKGEVRFDIWGPIADLEYWKLCQKVAESLPPNVQVEYKGVVEADKVSDVLSKYDLFFLPTLGENFGHAIIEALSSGCPVLISDQTPWKDLDRAGSEALPLNDAELFSSRLQRWVDMDAKSWSQRSQQARTFAQSFASNSNHLKAYRDLFSG
jgi:glycosyltransferase involved in cell wall biosynthesis